MEVADLGELSALRAIVFRHKRKTLRNNLTPAYGKDLVDGLTEAKLRAEQMSVARTDRTV